MDMKLKCQALENEILYLRVSINCVALKCDSDHIDNNMYEGTLIEIADQLVTNQLYIIDLSSHEGSIEITEKFVEMVSKSNIVVIGDDKIRKASFKAKGNWEEFSKNEFAFFYETDYRLRNYIAILKVQIKDQEKTIDFFDRLIVTYFFFKDLKTHTEYNYSGDCLKYLETSNVYVNKYINVKSLFLDANYTLFVVKALVRLIKKISGIMTDNITLLGVSNAGIILANLLTYEMALVNQAQSINCLGPVYCLDDDTQSMLHLGNKSFILVSDVICMGAEYKMTKAIVNSLGSKLLGGVSIVKLRNIYRNKEEKNIYSLVNDINELTFNEDSIDYIISIDNKMEVEKEDRIDVSL